MMSKRKRETQIKFYAVRTGYNPGVYSNWKECLQQVTGFKGAVFKSFLTTEEAQQFVQGKDPSTNPNKFYGVRSGKVPGVYSSWAETQAQVVGVQKPKYKLFSTPQEAQQFVDGIGDEPEDTEEKLSRRKQPSVPRAEDAQVSELHDPYAAKAEPKSKVTSSKTTVLSPDIAYGDDDDDAYGELDADILKELELQTSESLLIRKTEPSSQKHIVVPKKDSILKIYTDGSSLANGKASARAGVGIWFGHGDHRNLSEPLNDPKATNNRAELTAILRAIEIAPKYREVLIYTDSKYSISCVTDWFQKWRSNKWQTAAGKPVENQDIIEEILKRIEGRHELGVKTKFEWVNGHTGNEGNEAADRLAVAGAQRDRRGV